MVWPACAEQVVRLVERRPGVRVVALPAAHVGEVAERRRNGGAIAELPADAHALLEPGAGARVVADEPVVDAEVVQLPDDAAQVAELAVDRRALPARPSCASSTGASRLPWAMAVARALVRARQPRQPQQRLEAARSLRGDGRADPSSRTSARPRRSAQSASCGGDQVIERGAVVVVLALAARQPLVPLRGRDRSRALPRRARGSRRRARAASPDARRSRRAAPARTRAWSRAS